MSIQAFSEFLDSHPDVAQKVASCATFDDVSVIAKANGFEVTGAELTQHAAKATSELSDESLEAVAGGAWSSQPTDTYTPVVTNPVVLTSFNPAGGGGINTIMIK